MIDPSNERDVDGVLGLGRLSGSSKDRIFENVAGAVARERPPRPARRLVAIVASGGLTLAAAIVLVPRFIPPSAPSTPSPSSRPKGSPQEQGAAGPTLGVACIGGTLAACPQGATLMFGASGRPGSGYLSAYAEPLGRGAGAERVWYFCADGESPLLTVTGPTQAAERAVHVGSDHPPGHYRIHVMLSGAPVSCTSLLDEKVPDVLSSSTVELQVVPTATPAAP